MNTHHMLCFLLLLFFSTAKLSVGLVKFEVIPPTSPDSPFYIGHLPFWEMINVSIQQSNSRESYIASLKNKHTQNNTLTQYIGLDSVHSPQIFHQRSSSLYAVRLQIGTPPITYFLALDTASDIIWLQCSECFPSKCFSQDSALFKCGVNKGGSETCRPIRCANDQDCQSRSCIGNRCSYVLPYYDNSQTAGYFARETFTFDSYHSENLVFGCGIEQLRFKYFGTPNVIAGVMGMSRASTSLPSQLGAGIFSHCLPSEVGQPRPSYLSFGSEIPTRDFATVPLDPEYKTVYSVRLTALSINDDEPEVAVDQNALAIIDTGTSITVLAPRVYRKLVHVLRYHFTTKPEIKGRMRHKELLCYKWNSEPRTPHDHLPDIKFKLGTKHFRIKPQAAFVVNKDQFCLWMTAGFTDTTLIGARTLTNQHIIYDTRRNYLHFKPHTC